MENEEWRPVSGYELTYEVSSFGRVRSLDRMIGHPGGGKRLKVGQIIKPCFSHAGYLQVNLWNAQHNNTQKVHRLVAIAFLPNPDNYEHVNHKDFDRTNNRVGNLEWCSPKQNTRHMIDAGRMIVGEDKKLAKLNELQVIEIRRVHSENKIGSRVKKGTVSSLAEKHGVSVSLIEKVVGRINWKHI